MPDAAWGVAKLRKLGHRIVVITGRTDAFCHAPYKTAEEELANGGIIYDKLICTLDKASACVAENISDPILFTSKGNRDVKTDFIRVSSWKEAVEVILM